MSSSFRFVAPAGAPFGPADVARAAARAVTRNDRRSLGRVVAARFEIPHAVPTSTGRAGMTLLLRALRRLAPSDRTEVILPSYTCYSVAASTVKAGLQVRLVDIAPHTLDFAPEHLERVDMSRVLAIVATNLYGLPNNLPWLSSLARARGVFLIDDAAQSMGARVGGRWSGTWGDAGLFSFDKGKPVSAIDAGVVVTNSDVVAAALEAECQPLNGPSLIESAMNAAKVAAYAALLRPRLYWIPQRIPQLGLGRTLYDTAFPLERADPLLAALATVALEHLEDYTGARIANAQALLDRIRHLPDLTAITPIAGATSTYLRLPLLLADPVRRPTALAALHKAGIGATASYPTSLVDIPQLSGALRSQVSEAEGGRYVASHVITLPTHPYVTTTDVERMADVLTRVAALPTDAGQRRAGGDPSPLCAE